MSAFMVTRTHIDAMVNAALHRHYAGYFYRGSWVKTDATDATRIGALLWLENYRSVGYRYDDYPTDDLAEIERYTYSVFRPRKQYTTLDILKAIRGYEYQACEHPDWKESEAYAFCQYLKEDLITRLPGYENGPWAIPDGAV